MVNFKVGQTYFEIKAAPVLLAVVPRERDFGSLPDIKTVT